MHTQERKEEGRRQTVRNYYQKLTNWWKVYGDNQRDKMRQKEDGLWYYPKPVEGGNLGTSKGPLRLNNFNSVAPSFLFITLQLLFSVHIVFYFFLFYDKFCAIINASSSCKFLPTSGIPVSEMEKSLWNWNSCSYVGMQREKGQGLLCILMFAKEGRALKTGSLKVLKKTYRVF